MQFTVTCPVDGTIEVGLEDIDTVVLRGAAHADMTFVCPHCGTSITVGAVVPTFLLAAMRTLAEEPGSDFAALIISGESVPHESLHPMSESLKIEAYCEYFRRQLEGVVAVEDALAEIDSKATST